jgi:glycosyltransferase involved in cell wall biosynthesis
VSPPRTRNDAPRALIVVHSYYVRDTRPRRHATALVDAGWEVDVVCARDAGELPEEDVRGVHVTRLPARRMRGSKLRYIFEYVSFALVAFAAVTRAHVRRHYRTVYVIGIPNFLVFSALVPRLLGARVILDMRDPLPEFFRSKYGLAEKHPLVKLLLAEEKLSARFASHVVTVHHSMAELYARSVPSDRISIVYNAPDPRLFASPGAQRRNGANRTMLYAGTVAERYGVDLAVEALARLCDEIPSLRLRIVGDGDLIPSLKRRVGQLGIAARVTFDDPVPLDRIPAVVAESWVGVQPARDDPLMRYSFSTKILEWCLLGLPVICGATLPVAEVFAADELLLHPPGDLEAMCERIREADRDSVKLAERVERARVAATRYRFEDQASMLIRAVGEDAARPL